MYDRAVPALLCLLVTSLVIGWSRGPAAGQVSPRYTREELRIQDLASILAADKLCSILLARVTRVDKQPADVYRQFAGRFPGRNPDHYLYSLGGSFQVIETLTGPAAPRV